MNAAEQLRKTYEITEAIILAGGAGTRLREAVPDLPKPLAPVNDKPFLSYVIDSLRRQGIQRFIFSLGYMAEKIEAFLSSNYPYLDFAVVTETEPLGTGGGIQLALAECHTKTVLIANGDTLFEIDLKALHETHYRNKALCTLALKAMESFDRYGVVTFDEKGAITHFLEKKPYSSGLINGGIYLLEKNRFMDLKYPSRFSFEKEFLEKMTESAQVFGQVQEGYFIDIGIPEDYEKAQRDLKRPPLDLSQVDSSWTLFLDRDGVINEEKVGTYVLDWSEFIFSTGVLTVFQHLSKRFGKLFIVTNQRGVGKGLMDEATLQSIHLEMQREVAIVHGKIDQIYYCTSLNNKDFYRKPNPGMALKAREDHPEVDLVKSIMVGNKPSDMQFGRAAGMFTVFIASTNPEQPFPHPDIDLYYHSLEGFAHSL